MGGAGVSAANTERAVLGVILGDVAGQLAGAMAAGVRAEWFADADLGVFWRALESVWKRGKAGQADAISVVEEAERVNAALPERDRSDANFSNLASELLASEAMGDSAALHIANLRDAYLKRRFRAAIKTAEKSFARNSAEEAGAEMRRALDDVLSDAVAEKKISARALCREILAESRAAHERRIVQKDLTWTPGLKMPWERLTRIYNGLRPGLHVIAARPSVGKTAFVVNLIRFWCDHGVHVALNSLDMPRVEMMRRFVAELSRVSLSKALFSPTQTDLTAMGAAGEKIGVWPIALSEIRDIDDFRTYCMVEKAAGRLDVVVCDYLQLFHARALGREDAVEYARVSYVSDTLKRLANELNVPVVALCQLNRESAKADQQGREPGLADLRGSGSIEQDAFTVLLLHRDAAVVDAWKKSGAPRAFFPGGMENTAQIYGADDLDAVWAILCKSQNGATGKYPFVVRKRYFAWMLGDYEASPIENTVGHGATERTTYDNTPHFLRVHSDWRHDAYEAELRRNGALIEDSPPVKASVLPLDPEPAAVDPYDPYPFDEED